MNRTLLLRTRLSVAVAVAAVRRPSRGLTLRSPAAPAPTLERGQIRVDYDRAPSLTSASHGRPVDGGGELEPRALDGYSNPEMPTV